MWPEAYKSTYNEKGFYAWIFNVLLMCLVTEDIEMLATFISRKFQ
jgi:hypothetical protein